MQRNKEVAEYVDGRAWEDCLKRYLGMAEEE